MKKLTFYGLFIGLLTLSLSACKKGDVGSKGDKGDTGTQGQQGIKGSDGSTILSGNAAPETGLGKIGDFYLNKYTSEFYGPKTDAGWGNSISLKGGTGTNGANGTNGADGSKILSGSGTPTMSLGNLGDFYLDSVGVVFYGPKNTKDWGNQLSLINNKTAIKTFIFTKGFDDIVLEEKKREYVSTPFLEYLNTLSFTFNYDDSVRRANYASYNDGRYITSKLNPPATYIPARLMNKVFDQWLLESFSQTMPGVVGESFSFVNDLNKTLYISTKEDSSRMKSIEYRNYLDYPLDPTLKIGEKIRFANQISRRIDSLDTYGYSYSSKFSFDLKTLCPEIKNVIENGVVFIYWRNYNNDEVWDGGDINAMRDTMGSVMRQINDSTNYQIEVDITGLQKKGLLNINANFSTNTLNIIPENPYEAIYYRFGGRKSNYNADDFRNIQYYQIKIVVIPSSEVITLSSKGVNIKDKNAVLRALNL